MPEFLRFLAAWTLFGAGCSAWMFLRETLRQRPYAAVRVRRHR